MSIYLILAGLCLLQVLLAAVLFYALVAVPSGADYHIDAMGRGEGGENGGE